MRALHFALEFTDGFAQNRQSPQIGGSPQGPCEYRTRGRNRNAQGLYGFCRKDAKQGTSARQQDGADGVPLLCRCIPSQTGCRHSKRGGGSEGD
jgi:hypothetical protein